MDIVQGAELPPFVRKTGYHHWNRFAAVNDEFVPIHMDDEAGRQMGFPGAIGMGNLIWSYAHNVLRDWMGSNGCIERISVQYRAPNLRESTVTVQGKVTEILKADDGRRAVIELWADDDNERRLMNGQATVRVRD